MHELLRWTKRRELATALRKRGHRVSGETLNRWVRNKEEIPLPVQRDIRDLLGLEQQKEAPPEWAGRLERMELWLRAIAVASKAPADLLAEIEAATRDVLGPRSDEPPRDAPRQTATPQSRDE